MDFDLSSVFTYAAAAGGLGGLAILAKGTFYTIQQETQGLVTRFGKHVRTNTDPGLKVKIPLVEKVKPISMQEYQTGEDLETKTTDDLFVKLPIAIHYQISDPATFHFKKGNAVELMKKVVATAVREYTSRKSFQELYDERQEIKTGVLEKVADQVGGYGIQINDIIVDEPQASSAVKSTFDRVRSSALEREAATNEAEADYIKKVKAAEADKDRDFLRGEGAAGYRQKIFEQYAEQIQSLVDNGTPREEAVRVMMAIMQLDTYREIGGEGNMVIVTGNDTQQGDRIAELQTLGAAQAGGRPGASPRP